MLNVGNYSFVKEDEIEAIAPPESAPIKRLVTDAKDNKTCIDLTYGKKTRSVLIMKTGKIILSCVTSATLNSNINKFEEE